MFKDVPEDLKKTNSLPFSRRARRRMPGTSRLVSLTSIPGMAVEQIVLETMSKQMKVKEGIRRSQHQLWRENNFCPT